ncbi:MAG: ComF family protein [Ruminococcaceae bacterium]|nr:ComF family protein [Oscillospiraceae bacterium]
MKLIRKILEAVSVFFDFLLELIFPPRCLICSEIYPKNDLKTKLHICGNCRKKIRFISEFDSVCRKCSRPIEDGNILCPLCQVSGYSFDAALSCAVYENDLRKALLSYKFGGQRYKYREFAEMILFSLASSPHYMQADVICSVPISNKRKKKRGFDHIHPISKYISFKTGIPYAKGVIAKIKEVPPQSKLSFKERRLSVAGAFKVMNPCVVRDKTVILIDDIMTTGATVSEISRILKRAGAKRVIVLTICITKLKRKGDE